MEQVSQPQERVPTIRNIQPSGSQSGSGWRAVAGETLDQVLSDWAHKAQWRLVFNSQVLYEIQAGAEFQGSFTEAVSALVHSNHTRPMPIATFYSGNRVLLITNDINN